MTVEDAYLPSLRIFSIFRIGRWDYQGAELSYCTFFFGKNYGSGSSGLLEEHSEYHCNQGLEKCYNKTH